MEHTLIVVFTIYRKNFNIFTHIQSDSSFFRIYLIQIRTYLVLLELLIYNADENND